MQSHSVCGPTAHSCCHAAVPNRQNNLVLVSEKNLSHLPSHVGNTTFSNFEIKISQQTTTAPSTCCLYLAWCVPSASLAKSICKISHMYGGVCDFLVPSRKTATVAHPKHWTQPCIVLYPSAPLPWKVSNPSPRAWDRALAG